MVIDSINEFIRLKEVVEYAIILEEEYNKVIRLKYRNGKIVHTYMTDALIGEIKKMYGISIPLTSEYDKDILFALDNNGLNPIPVLVECDSDIDIIDTLKKFGLKDEYIKDLRDISIMLNMSNKLLYIVKKRNLNTGVPKYISVCIGNKFKVHGVVSKYTQEGSISPQFKLKLKGVKRVYKVNPAVIYDIKPGDEISGMMIGGVLYLDAGIIEAKCKHCNTSLYKNGNQLQCLNILCGDNCVNLYKDLATDYNVPESTMMIKTLDDRNDKGYIKTLSDIFIPHDDEDDNVKDIIKLLRESLTRYDLHTLIKHMIKGYGYAVPPAMINKFEFLNYSKEDFKDKCGSNSDFIERFITINRKEIIGIIKTLRVKSDYYLPKFKVEHNFHGKKVYVRTPSRYTASFVTRVLAKAGIKITYNLSEVDIIIVGDNSRTVKKRGVELIHDSEIQYIIDTFLTQELDDEYKGK